MYRYPAAKQLLDSTSDTCPRLHALFISKRHNYKAYDDHNYRSTSLIVNDIIYVHLLGCETQCEEIQINNIFPVIKYWWCNTHRNRHYHSIYAIALQVLNWPPICRPVHWLLWCWPACCFLSSGAILHVCISLFTMVSKRPEEREGRGHKMQESKERCQHQHQWSVLLISHNASWVKKVTFYSYLLRMVYNIAES